MKSAYYDFTSFCSKTVRKEKTMKQCRVCGILSRVKTLLCCIRGTKLSDTADNATDEVLPMKQNVDNKSSPEAANADVGNGKLLFNGVYQYKESNCSSYLRFFADGKVVEVSSTGTPAQVARWLNHNYQSYGFYAIENNIVKFTITSSCGKVSYSGRLDKEAIIIDVTSHINGYQESNLKYIFCSL